MQLKAFFAGALLLLSQVHAAPLTAVVTGDADLKTLLALVASQPAIMGALGGFKGTLFAPTDKAFEAVVAAGFDPKKADDVARVLQYHVVPSLFPTASFKAGDTAFLTTLEGSEVKATQEGTVISIGSAAASPATVVRSLPFDDGVVHVIDAVLIPPANIVDVATAGKLTALLAALTKSGLASTVAGLKNVTILAPVDEAFAAIKSVADTLTVDQLKQVLLLHVVPGIVHSTDILAAKSIDAVPTLAGGKNTLKIAVDGENVVISGAKNDKPAKVVAADIFAANMIVHVIDTVLLPDFADAVAASPAASSAAPTASGAASAAASGSANASGAAKTTGGAAATSSPTAAASPKSAGIVAEVSALIAFAASALVL
ncbi:hypothetical protein HDU77_003062 [Chytriomyces hyalinus]|nr:hypothetical protein HDU77_003062 [Chytriomyces hyalinus]